MSNLVCQCGHSFSIHIQNRHQRESGTWLTHCCMGDPIGLCRCESFIDQRIAKMQDVVDAARSLVNYAEEWSPDTEYLERALSELDRFNSEEKK